MQKKTRKEKIQSQQRRQLRNDNPISVIVQKTQSVQERTEISQNPVTISLSQEEINIQKYFARDLRKSLLIIGAIFALEFFFYFATMNNYLLQYLNF